nr:hypothetical protein CFP56_79344 [Quercus suber]
MGKLRALTTLNEVPDWASLPDLHLTQVVMSILLSCIRSGLLRVIIGIPRSQVLCSMHSIRFWGDGAYTRTTYHGTVHSDRRCDGCSLDVVVIVRGCVRARCL